MMKYQHSEVMAVLKATDEKIKGQLTSFQYLSVLDDHLYNALKPLISGTKFFDVFLSQIIGWQTQNPKRKTCGVGRSDLVALSTLFFLTQDPAQKLRLVRRMKLHRNIIFEALQRWLDLLADYPQLSTMIGNQEVIIKLFELNEAALMRPGFNLHATLGLVKYWTFQAKSFKEKICEKYYRMTCNWAQRDYVKMGCPMPLNDFIQIYIMTMSKAIDKCDADRGVLTAHIQTWFKSAKNVAQKQAHTKGSEGEHVSLEDVDVAVNDNDARERQDTIDRVRIVARVFDPQGYGRIMLGIQEHLSKEERQILRSMALRPMKGMAVPG